MSKTTSNHNKIQYPNVCWDVFTKHYLSNHHAYKTCLAHNTNLHTSITPNTITNIEHPICENIDNTTNIIGDSSTLVSWAIVP